MRDWTSHGCAQGWEVVMGFKRMDWEAQPTSGPGFQIVSVPHLTSSPCPGLVPSTRSWHIILASPCAHPPSPLLLATCHCPELHGRQIFWYSSIWTTTARVCSYELYFIPFSLLECRFLCNTSGSGKTRRMLEGLTKYWGFYFVAVPDINRVGLPDLEQSLERMAEDPQWVSDLRGLSLNKRAGQNDLNRRIAWRELLKILAARIIVFELFKRLAIKVDGRLLEKHKRICWLLFQSVWPSQEETLHPFCKAMEGCLRNASLEALDVLVFRLHDIHQQYFPGARFILGLDEAQHAARLYPYSFISSSNLNRYRSIIHEITNFFLPICRLTSLYQVLCRWKSYGMPWGLECQNQTSLYSATSACSTLGKN